MFTIIIVFAVLEINSLHPATIALQLFLYYACEYPIILELLSTKLPPIIPGTLGSNLPIACRSLCCEVITIVVNDQG